MFALGSAKVLPNAPALISEVAKSVKEVIDLSKQSVPSNENPAKKCAQTLMGKLTLLIGDEEYGSVLRRFKNQINENAKMPAFIYTMPEGFHNDIEGLATLNTLAKVQPLMLRTNEETDAQRRTHDQLVRSMQDLGFPPPFEFRGAGSDKLSQLITAVTFGDFVSVYLAALRGVDPAELTLIPKFRAIMRAS
jgi:glucose/mannose-6-phosphate isomerase